MTAPVPACSPRNFDSESHVLRATSRLGGGTLNGFVYALDFGEAPGLSSILQLRLWLRAGGMDPDRDVRIIVLSPEQMCDSLARGVRDGFCVGEPWNTVSVQQGIGAIAASGYEIWNNAPEKVLGVSEAWHRLHPATHLRLRLALMEACLQLREPTSSAVRELHSRSHAPCGSVGCRLPRGPHAERGDQGELVVVQVQPH